MLINFLTRVQQLCFKKRGKSNMINLGPLSQTQPKDTSRPLAGSVGLDRVAGSAPPAALSGVGPANPRMRLDRDLGMVVIEFRDSAGRVSVSLPTPREIEAYRASLKFGADLPPDIKGMNVTPGGPSAARPGIPLPPEEETLIATRPDNDSEVGTTVSKLA
jgi:hypothetical protein